MAKVISKGAMTTRPLEQDELINIIKLATEGFIYEEGLSTKRFRPNKQVALALTLEANLGIRISDIMKLKVKNFKGNKIETREKKTGKLQYRSINPNITSLIMEYAMDKGLRKDDDLFSISVKAVQKQLRIIKAHMALENIGTHSFRKFYATTQYERNNSNIELVKELLNHSSIATTQRYINVSQKAIDKASSDFYIDLTL